MLREFLKGLKTPEQRLAWLVAVGADVLQIAVLPLFVEGGFSPADLALDAVMAVVLTRLLGWHWAFVPSMLAELVPGLDLFPTWTAAVFFVTRRQAQGREPEILPPGHSLPGRR